MKRTLLLFLITILIVCFLAFNISAEDDELTTTELSSADITTVVVTTVENTTVVDTSGGNTDDTDDTGDTDPTDNSSVELTLPNQNNNNNDDVFSFGSINWGVYIIFSIVASVVIGAIIILANPVDRKK